MCNATQFALSFRKIAANLKASYRFHFQFSFFFVKTKCVELCAQDQFSHISKRDKFSSFVLERDFISSFHNAFAFDRCAPIYLFQTNFFAFHLDRSELIIFSSLPHFMYVFLFVENVHALTIIPYIFIQSLNCSGWRWTSHACSSFIHCVCHKTYKEIIGKN